MRLLTVALAAAVALLAIVPSASAAHCCGPCSHEWAEIALAAPGNFKSGGLKYALFEAGDGANACLDATLGWPCQIVGCEISLP